ESDPPRAVGFIRVDEMMPVMEQDQRVIFLENSLILFLVITEYKNRKWLQKDAFCGRSSYPNVIHFTEKCYHDVLKHFLKPTGSQPLLARCFFCSQAPFKRLSGRNPQIRNCIFAGPPANGLQNNVNLLQQDIDADGADTG
ncbi:hypothetical protein STEG23_008615, partial [Scotinomys teguina]